MDFPVAERILHASERTSGSIEQILSSESEFAIALSLALDLLM